MKLVGEKLYFLSLGKDCLDHTKHEAEEKKTDKLYIIKLKTSLQKAQLNAEINSPGWCG